MKVFVLENGCYSDTHIVGIYSTRELADMAGRIFRDDVSVTEWDVDDAAEEMRRGCVPYFVRLNRESGDVMDIYEASSYGAFGADVGEDVHKNLYTNCWAENKPAAIRIAGDRRRAFLALPTEV